MSLSSFYFRSRWLHAPAGLLIMLLQRTPVLRLLSQAGYVIEGNGGAVLKSAFALAALGAYNSVAGATTFSVSPATPASGPMGTQFAISGAAGSAMNEVFRVSGAPGSPRSWSVTGTLPPGVSVVGGNPVNVAAPYSMTISGTPTTQGLWTVTVNAWEKANTTGNRASITCVFTITSGSTSTAPVFTMQPQSVTVAAGATTTFSATAGGTPAPSYQWYHDATLLSGQTSSSLTLTNPQASDAGGYAVVASNSAGSVTSNTATLTVLTPPSITSQPQSTSVVAGSAVTFSTTASGTAPLSYQWLKGGAAIAGATGASYTIGSVQPADAGSYTVFVSNSVGSVASNAAMLTVQAVPSITTPPQSITVTTGSSATFTVTAGGTAPLGYQWRKGGMAITGANAANYTVSNTQAGDAGSYSVVVSNSIGSVTSSSATLTVQSAPAITTQPQSASAPAGTAVTFTVGAGGTAPLSYQWRKDGVAIGGATGASYTLTNVQPADAGSYTVLVSNTVGSVLSGAAILAVHTSPVITTPPQNISVIAGGTATFTVTASGKAPLTYQWQKGGVAISGATSATYSIAGAQLSDAGSYTVIVTNSLGSLTGPAATLTVTSAAIAPSITTQPQAVTVTAGANATLLVVAAGSAPLGFQWRRDGTAIAAATAANYTITGVQTADAGNYTVVVSNSAGSVTSVAATLTVNAAAVAPSITTQPQSATVAAGSAVTFSVTASGAAPLSYQWQKDGAAIAGETTSSYTIARAQMNDAGDFSVVVSNGAGSIASSSATLTVSAALVAPAITTQPQSVTATAGDGVVFSVVASGAAPLSYQWQKNGTVIGGATSASYTLVSAQPADAGAYRVVVSNSVGSATSAPATLQVNLAPAAPTITTQPSSQTVATGHDVSFAAGAAGYPAATYSWWVSTDGGASWTVLQDGANYSGTTTNTLTVRNASVAMNGYRYRSVAANSSGSATSNALTLTVSTPVFPAPAGLAVDAAGVIFVSDASLNTIQTVNTAWQVSLLAGTSGQQGSIDGTGGGALFRQPGGGVLDNAGNFYVADMGNSIIRRITPGGTVTTVAGSSSGQGYRDGPGQAAWFNSPAGVASDLAGNLYVADAGNAVIRKIATDGTVTTLVGAAGATGSTDGMGSAARFNQPSGVALDAGGNLYVSDTFNQTVRKVTPAGAVTTLAGLAGVSGSSDGSGPAALFNQPRGLCVDSAGNVFVADTANSCIRKITPAGVVTTVAGLSTVAGFLDGVGVNAWLNQPRDVKIDAAGNLYVADTGNAAIRKITSAGVVTTPLLTAGAPAVTQPSTPAAGNGSSDSSGPPPGKSGAGGIDVGLALATLAVLTMQRRRPTTRRRNERLVSRRGPGRWRP